MSISNLFTSGLKPSQNIIANSLDAETSISIPHFTASKVTQLIPSGGSGADFNTFDTVEGDLKGGFDLASGNFTVSIEGHYLVNISCRYPHNPGGSYRLCSLNRNGGTLSQGYLANIGGILAPNASLVRKYQVGDIINTSTLQNSGASLSAVLISFSVVMLSNK